jgi:hypothetical protein
MRLLEKLSNHLCGIADPVDAMVETLAYTLEWLPSDKPFQLILAHDMRKTSAGITSPRAKQFGRGLLEGLDVDWRAMGFNRRGIDDLVEYTLRILQSLMIDPGRPPRNGKSLRNYLRRWVGPVVAAEVARHSR